MEEAALWDDVLAHVDPGRTKVTVLIETPPAAFEMDRDPACFVHAHHRAQLRMPGSLFSYITTFRAHRDKVLPRRARMSMTQPC